MPELGSSPILECWLLTTSSLVWAAGAAQWLSAVRFLLSDLTALSCLVQYCNNSWLHGGPFPRSWIFFVWVRMNGSGMMLDAPYLARIITHHMKNFIPYYRCGPFSWLSCFLKFFALYTKWCRVKKFVWNLFCCGERHKVLWTSQWPWPLDNSRLTANLNLK